MSLTFPSDQTNTATKASSFLDDLENRVLETIATLERITGRLGEAGFYGPPENATASDKPSENNPRSRIIERLDRVHTLSNYLETQVSRVA